MFKITWRNILFLSLISIPNTILTFGILYFINTFIQQKDLGLGTNLPFLFFGIILLSFGLNILLQRKIISYTYTLIYESEIKIFKALQKTSFAQLNNIGTNRIYGIIEDVRMFVFFPGVLASTISSLITLLICIVYYFVLSVVSTIVVLVAILALASLYLVVNRRLAKKVEYLRSLNDTYFEVVNDTIDGFKELKMSSRRSYNLFTKFIEANRLDVKNTETRVANKYLVLSLFSQYGLYVLLGLILFVFPFLGFLNKEQVLSFIVILLFIAGPIINLIAMQNNYVKYYVANKRITRFLAVLKTHEHAHPKEVYKEIAPRSFEKIEFRDVVYTYTLENSDTPFCLGPLNLTIIRGESLFLIGGNGSGKSTFINCLTGLYPPTSGSIIINDDYVINDNPAYRDLISAIFTDNHLFSRNYEDYTLEGNETYAQILKTMKLQKVVTRDDERSARRKFSKGQSKRMAMIFALLEDRPILVLDEWAADQDPYFRKYFYHTLLPDLKKKGKTIIAVTHDDAYFSTADRIIKFDFGKIVYDSDLQTQKFASEIIWGN